ncbi:MAG: hypothetical protein ACLQIB_50205 [Isosphaeraceae bacterium]
MRNTLIRSLALAITSTLVLGFALHSAGFEQTKDKGQDRDKDTPQLPVEVFEWSIWVGNPAQTTINTARVYKNAMPGVIGTIRPKFEEKDLTARFPVAPISIVQFFGKAHHDVDVDLRAKKGMFLAHWPAAKEHTGRLTWFGSDLTEGPPAGIPQSYLPGTHWLARLRENPSALFLKNESHVERFIAYDTELPIATPIRLRGGPDEYTLQNLTSRRLLDIAVIAPSESGFRVGWLDELPTAVPEKKEEPAPKKTADPKQKAVEQKEKADALFRDAEKKSKEEEIPPLPAEGDATVRARVDQLLNQPVAVTVEQAPRRDVLGLIMRQARLRYEIDERTLTKEQINLGEPMSMQATRMAARDALADVLGNLGLSYRVTEESKLFITTAARLAEDAGKKGAPIAGPPVKLGMSQPRKAGDPSYRESTRDALARRLAGQGLRDDVVEFLLERYSKVLFEPGELIVLLHLSREAIDETILLDVFPPPKKFVRTALLVIHGVDPRLQDRARVLVKQLGDKSPKERETAESRLFEMGPVAVPVLEDALTNKDVEIVFRAERLLMRMNRPVQ